MQRLNAIFQSAPGWVALYEEDGNLVVVNEYAITRLGRSLDELRHVGFSDLFTGSHKMAIEAAISKALAEGIASTEAVYIAPDQHCIVWNVSICIISPDGVNGRRIAVNAIDLTDQKQVEQRIREAEANYRSIFVNALEGIFQTSPEGNYISANPALARIYGYDSVDELILGLTNISSQLYVDTDSRLRFRELVERDDCVTDFEAQVYRKDGSVIWISEQARAVRDPDGRLLYYEGLVEDITSRKNAEEQLKAAESKYRSVFENSLDGIFQTTPDGQYLSVNPALARIYGYDSPQDLINNLTNISRQLYVDASRREEFRARMEENDFVTDFESQIYQKDGTIIWISEHARSIRDAQGKLLYYEGAVEDITKRKRAEQQVRDEIQEREKAELEVRQLNEYLQSQLDRIAALRRIDLAIASSLDLRLSLNVVLDQVINQLKVDAAAILICNQHNHTLAYNASKGLPGGSQRGASLKLGNGKLGEALMQGQIFHCEDLQDQPDLLEHAPRLLSCGMAEYYAVPLLAKGQVKGLLEIFNRTPIKADAEWEDYLEVLGGQAAIAIDSAGMFTDLQRSNVELTLAYDATIEGWAKALDIRDTETQGHSKRVTDLSLRLARALGVEESELVHLRRGALLHDIGKMGTPDSILLKPGKLNAEERKIMEQHTQNAYDLLWPVPYLRPALDIPYCHHEKWDGTGYPRGLKGESIPLAARIFAVVDVWDALTNDRPYRAAWSKEDVRQHIRELSGTHFDPRVVEVFLLIAASNTESLNIRMYSRAA